MDIAGLRLEVAGLLSSCASAPASTHHRFNQLLYSVERFHFIASASFFTIYFLGTEKMVKYYL